MIWQDLILIAGNFVFILALIPSLKSKNKPSFYTSLPNSIIMTVFGITLFTLNLWGSAVLTLILASMWGILAIQKYKTREK